MASDNKRKTEKAKTPTRKTTNLKMKKRYGKVKITYLLVLAIKRYCTSTDIFLSLSIQ